MVSFNQKFLLCRDIVLPVLRRPHFLGSVSTTRGQRAIRVVVVVIISLVFMPITVGKYLSQGVCMIQVALAVMPMVRTADWAKGRGPKRPIVPTPQTGVCARHAKTF